MLYYIVPFVIVVGAGDNTLQHSSPVL